LQTTATTRREQPAEAVAPLPLLAAQIKPVAGTESCQVRHVGVADSGRIAVKHEDGTELQIGAGEAYVIEPGHDAWVIGDEGFVGFEFEERSAEEYAMR
jgi:hypothetical protein